jgi:hypothetical protein
MAEGKKSFILYADVIDTFEHLTNEQRGEVIWWILQYVNDRKPEPLNGLLMAVIANIRAQLKRDLDKYRIKLEQSSESGRIGNLKRWNTDLYSDYLKGVYTLEEAENIAKDRKVSPPDTTRSHPIAKIADSVTDNGTDTVNVNDNDFIEVGSTEVSTKPSEPPKPKRSIFIPPELHEVQNYCIERQNKIDPEQWHNHYTANGWMVGRSKMKDWKAAVRTWEKNDFNTVKNATTTTIQKGNQGWDEAVRDWGAGK